LIRGAVQRGEPRYRNRLNSQPGQPEVDVQRLELALNRATRRHSELANHLQLGKVDTPGIEASGTGRDLHRRPPRFRGAFISTGDPDQSVPSKPRGQQITLIAWWARRHLT
jgi:hypothetical protein